MAVLSPEQLARAVIDLAVENVRAGGGPFAALIASGGQIIATGVNRVTANNDPTAHAEVQAIRAACHKLGHFELRGCELYTSCEPCPMCLGASYWTRVTAVYYCGSRAEAAAAGFDDSFIYDESSRHPEKRTIPFRRLLAEEGRRPFEAWAAQADKTLY
jgi:tRNA(Arg) A34 adenosine deaminase TadA